MMPLILVGCLLVHVLHSPSKSSFSSTVFHIEKAHSRYYEHQAYYHATLAWLREVLGKINLFAHFRVIHFYFQSHQLSPPWEGNVSSSQLSVDL
jgi:hypothetical protein